MKDSWRIRNIDLYKYFTYKCRIYKTKGDYTSPFTTWRTQTLSKYHTQKAE